MVSITDWSVSTNDVKTLEAIVVFTYLWAKFKVEMSTVVGGHFNNSIDDLIKKRIDFS